MHRATVCLFLSLCLSLVPVAFAFGAGKVFTDALQAYEAQEYADAFMFFQDVDESDPVESARAGYYTGMIAMFMADYAAAADLVIKALESGLLPEEEAEEARIALAFMAERAPEELQDHAVSDFVSSAAAGSDGILPWSISFTPTGSYIYGIPKPGSDSANRTPDRTGDYRVGVTSTFGYEHLAAKGLRIKPGVSIDGLAYFSRDDNNFVSVKPSLRLSYEVHPGWIAFIEPVLNVDWSGDSWEHYATGGGGKAGIVAAMENGFGLLTTFSALYQDYASSDDTDGARLLAVIAPGYRLLDGDLAFSLPLSLGHTSADTSAFSYFLVSVIPQASFTFLERHSLTVKGGYSHRSYEGRGLIQTGVKRLDNVWTVGGGYEFAVLDSLTLFAEFSYVDNRSNIERQKYETYMTTLGASLAF